MNKDLSMVNISEILGGAIAVYQDAWSNPEETISKVESMVSDPELNIKFWPAQTREDTATGDKNKQSHRTNSFLYLKEYGKTNETFKKISDEYSKILKESSQKYKSFFRIGENILEKQDFQLLRYQSGEYFNAHYDGGTGSCRVISSILYLNDDYEGGEIEFTNFGIKIKPKAGMLLLFPSNYAYTHIAYPVTSGTKYAIVTWLHDR